MKKKNGYTIPEIIIVVFVVGVISFIGITKVSYAFVEINDTENQTIAKENLIIQATNAYAKSKKAEFKTKEPTYIYAKEVSTAGFLFEKEEYNSIKLKITYQEEKNEFIVEISK